MSIKVLLVDDHPMVLKGLRFFLSIQSDIEIIGEAHNGREALELIQVVEKKLDLVLMDLSMPEMDGIETTKQIKTLYPDIKVIILTSFSDQDHVLPAIRAGASGYQLKDVEPDELANMIRAVYKGRQWLHPEATTHLMSVISGEAEEVKQAERYFETLTSREKDVLREITNGKGNKEIAADLFITEKTVKTHVSNILSKLDLHDRTQAAIYAMKNKWFD